MLTYRQPLRAVDAYDKVIHTNQSQAVIWAIGPVNKKVFQGKLKIECFKILKYYLSVGFYIILLY